MDWLVSFPDWFASAYNYTIFLGKKQEMYQIKKENVMSYENKEKNDFFVTRIGENALPAVPLPFYPISTGISIYKRGHGEQVGGILNQFVRIAWLLSGTYETVIKKGFWERMRSGILFMARSGWER